MAIIDLYKLITKRRSIRLFKEKEIPLNIINKIINAARLAPSAANLQFLEYLVINKKKLREAVFEHLRWAAYISPKRNPPAFNAPALYIIILINRLKANNPNLRDVGAAAENILLSLVSLGLGGCWLQNIDKEALMRILKIKPPLEIDSLIAAGFPAEYPKLETDSYNIRYWLDKHNVLHVPKRPLRDVFHYNSIKSRE